MERNTAISDHLSHLGGGTSLVLAYLGLIPGFLPALALIVLVTAVLVAPFVILGLAAVLIAAPFYLGSRVLRRARRRRRREQQIPPVRPLPVPTPHAA